MSQNLSTPFIFQTRSSQPQAESLSYTSLLKLEAKYGSPQLWNQLDPAQVETMSDWMLIHRSRRAWGDHPELTRPPQNALTKTSEHLATTTFVFGISPLLDVASEYVSRKAWRKAHSVVPEISQEKESRPAGL
jgi:hypothetical protein